MALAAGLRLGSYAILDPLGAGGMGEVYRAIDTRLGREVAVKALPEEFSRDLERLARFDREARMLAALNHPSIAAIYGLEEFDGTRFIVMELVPGETLSESLSRGALPLEEALSIARQIAEALEAAHDRGIVHRDLKPANIKVTAEGRVKVLDLGLAKALDTKDSGDASLSPTFVLEETQPGVVLGTAGFMSPEQARGRSVDKRTDIWAFGCVLYELLSGRRAFTGETVTDILVAIVTAEPRWEALPPETPARVRDLLGRCLVKDANRRLRDIGDARIEIDEVLAEIGAGRTPRSGAVAPASFDRPRASAGRRLALPAIAILLVVAAGWWTLRSVRGRAAVPLPEQKYLAVLPFKDLSGTPGGQLIGDGLVVTISVRLSGISGIQVVNPTAVVTAADKEAEIYRIAKNLGANLVLRGTFQREGDRVRITYSVVSTRDLIQVAADSLDGSASDLFAMQDRLAEGVIVSLGLSSSVRRASPPGLDTASEQDRYLQAIGNLQRHDQAASVDAAVGLLKALALEKPSSALVHASLGRAYLHKFSFTRERQWVDLAVDSCSRARQLDATLPEVDVTLGEISTRTGQPKEAIEAFERALARQPNNLEAQMGLAGAYDASGDTAKAEESYRRAIQLQPGYWPSSSQLGVFYFKHGQYDRAAEMFRKVTELTPDNERAFADLGAVLFKAGKFEEAREAYKRSIRVKPSDRVYTNLGTLEFFSGRYAEAAAAFEEATRRTPGKHLYWSNLGDAYRWAPQWKSRSAAAYERAIRLAEGELSLNPRDDAAHRTLANCLAKTGQAARARVHIERAVEINPTDPASLYAAAIVAALAGRRDEAVEWIERACSAGLALRQVESEPEFNGLRGLTAYRKLLAKRRT